MRAQVIGFGEAFGAVGTNVGFLPRVDQLVPLQVPRLTEALPALRAGVRPLACVDPLVCL